MCNNSTKICSVCFTVGTKKDVFCPSGKQCPLDGGKVPWAFLPAEIRHILDTYTAPKYSHDRYATRGGGSSGSSETPSRIVGDDRSEGANSSSSGRLSAGQPDTTIPSVVESTTADPPQATLSTSNSGGDKERPASADKPAVKVKQERESV